MGFDRGSLKRYINYYSLKIFEKFKLNLEISTQNRL